MALIIPQRFSIAASWIGERLRGRGRHVPLGEMFAFLTAASWRRRGFRHIDHIDDAGDGLLAIHLLGRAEPLHWPKEEDLGMLSLILDEQLAPGNWHAYVTPETPLGDGDVAIDCGASEGLFSFLHFPHVRRVVAVEPNPLFIRAMEKTFAGNGKVRIEPVALGSRAGTARLNMAGAASSLGVEGIEVRIRTLDEIAAELPEPVTFLKADLEGFELDVLEGARETIFRDRPKVAITTYHNRAHPKEIAGFLTRIHPSYRTRLRGWAHGSSAVMLHAWS